MNFVEHLSHINGQSIDFRVEHVGNFLKHGLQFGDELRVETREQLLEECVFGLDFGMREDHANDTKFNIKEFREMDMGVYLAISPTAVLIVETPLS